MRSQRDQRGDNFDVRLTPQFEDRLIQAVLVQVRTQLGREVSKAVIDQIKPMLEAIMATAAELQAKMDALKAEVARNTDIDASIKQALDGNTALVADLKTQIEALKAAGAGAVTQEQLDALDTQAGDTLTVLQNNNNDLAAKVTQGTPAA